MHGQVIYELHIGTFTPEGTFDSAITRLDELKDLGITVIEVMPVAEFPGRWNWGYDGVGLYAPAHVYGDPEALKRFVDEAHLRGLGVILDVVYNHLGPDGNYLPAFSDDYFTDRYPNEWGQAINFDGPGSQGTREFFIQNACYWIEEFHMDGLRLDAVHAFHDAGPVHVVAELSQAARMAAGKRSIILVAECEAQWVLHHSTGRATGVGIGRSLERGFPSYGPCGGHGPKRRLLHRLSRHAAGTHFMRQTGVSLPRATIPMASQTTRDSRRARACGRLRIFHSKS